MDDRETRIKPPTNGSTKVGAKESTKVGAKESAKGSKFKYYLITDRGADDCGYGNKGLRAARLLHREKGGRIRREHTYKGEVKWMWLER